MRTTIDLPDEIMKKAKLKAVQDGITLKQLFIKALGSELTGSGASAQNAPWKKLRGSGTSAGLSASDSGFEGYSGPDWNHSIQVNEPKE